MKCTIMLLLLMMVVSSALSAVGQGDVCFHLSNGITGPDTAVIGVENTIEVWIANDALLTFMAPHFTMTFNIPLEWHMQYGSHPPVNEEGRAINVWNLNVADDFDNVSPEHFLICGAAMPGDGLPAGPSEMCYSLRFRLLEAGPHPAAIRVEPYWDFPTDFWDFCDPSCYPPDFCGEPYYSGPAVNPAVFPAVELPWICGDPARDGHVNISDVVFIAAYFWGAGPAPDPPSLGDVDCDGSVDTGDIILLVGYIFGGGPEPCAECP